MSKIGMAMTKVPNRSGFDKSFQNIFTMPVGTLVPLLCDEVIANTKVNLKVLISASLPPLAADTFMRCRVKLESFFVPFRQLYGGFSRWLAGEKIMNGTTSLACGVPVLSVNQNNISKFGPGSLADYLGYKFMTSDVIALESATFSRKMNPYPFLAYHWIYDNYYRKKDVQIALFSPVDSNTAINSCVDVVPYLTTSQEFNMSTSFQDGSSLFDLRQRNFGADYFSVGTTSPQAGSAQGITIDTSGSSDTFTIASLRAANSLQQFAERNLLAAADYGDYLRINYDAHLSLGSANVPIFINSGYVDVYSKGIDQTAPDAQSGTGNPFSGVGARYGSAYCNGEVNLIDGFTAQEPGLIFVMISLVPKATYSTGILRQNFHYGSITSQPDMANAVLQNTGPQPIYKDELCASEIASPSRGVFAYADRYSEYMTREDELHGLLRDGESLEAFALQRSFAVGGVQSTQFLAIPEQFLDQVSIGADLSDYGAWVDSFLDYKVTMPLQQFSIPSLENVDGQPVYVQKGGPSIRG